MIAAAALLLAQATVPSGKGLTEEQRIDILAREIVHGAFTQMDLFDDPEVRSEMKRVGLDRACPIAGHATRTSLIGESDAIFPLARQAVGEKFPAERLNTLRLVSFLMGSAHVYKSRVEARFDELAKVHLTVIRANAKTVFTGLTKTIPDQPQLDPQETLLPQAVVSGFGADPAQTFEKPALLSVACLTRQIPTEGSLQIKSGQYVWPERATNKSRDNEDD